MTQSFKTLCNYMSYMANTYNYQSWDNKQVGREFLANLEKAKDQFKNESINWDEITDDEYILLRFSNFDENNRNLIPLWLFRILPNETKLISFGGNIETIKTADDDVRFGCTAYMIYKETK